MSAARISFLDLSPAEASIAAQELREVLLRAGIPAEDLQLVRTDPDAQDLGSILVISNSFVVGAIPGVRELLWEGAKGAAAKVGGDLAEAIAHYFKIKKKVAAVIFPDGNTMVVGGSSPSQRRSLHYGKLGVVLLGASSFPFYPPQRKLDNPAFAKSSELIKSMFSPSKPPFNSVFLDRVVCVDFFDKGEGEVDILDAIDSKIASDADITDVLFYYCGHGQTLPNQSFILMLRNTRPGREAHTGLDAFRFLETLGSGPLANKRCFFIWDCCYATRAVRSIWPSSYGGDVSDWIPSKGTAFMAASDRSVQASARGTRGATMFTGALADVVLTPVEKPEWLTFKDLYDRVWQKLRDEYKQDAVLPECRSPDQSEGDIAKLPIVIQAWTATRAWGRSSPSPSSGEPGTKSVGGMDRETAPQPNVEAEPSMEEIMVSIREVIAEVSEPEKKEVETAEVKMEPPKIDPKLTVELSPFYADRKNAVPVQKQLSKVRSKTAESTATAAHTSDRAQGFQWYIARDGKQHGPLTDMELGTFAEYDYLRQTDLIWRPGMTEWQAAPGVFPELFETNNENKSRKVLRIPKV